MSFKEAENRKYAWEENPFREPICRLIDQLAESLGSLAFPYIHFLVRVTILLFLLSLMVLLWATVGVLYQIGQMFWDLSKEQFDELRMDNRSPIENSPYAIQAGIYFILYLPFLPLTLFFMLMGFAGYGLANKPYVTISLIMSVIVAILAAYYGWAQDLWAFQTEW